MKKLLTIIMILAMLMPAAAVADPDPIVGCWYVSINQDDLKPEGRITGISYEVRVLYFDETGIIKRGVFGFGNSYGLNEYRDPLTVGTWSKNDNGKYTTTYDSITAESYIEDDMLYIHYDKKNLLGWHRMIDLRKKDSRK